MIPGSNILRRALRLLKSQCVSYIQAYNRTINTNGQYATEFNNPVTIYGSFQPVPKRLYITYNLDFQKSYFVFYTSNNLVDIQRDVSADQIQFQNQLYQCLSSDADWFGIDGWKGVLCVLITATANSNAYLNQAGSKQPLALSGGGDLVLSGMQ